MNERVNNCEKEPEQVQENIQIENKPSVKISIRNLVEFIMRSGSIDNRRAGGADNAMAEGSRLHRMIQRRMDSSYEAEVTLRYQEENEDYTLCIEGRADGIITEYSVQEVTKVVTIDEIKCTYSNIDRMNGPNSVHLAQAKCYAYIYAQKEYLEHISVRMTYCNIDTEEIRYFVEEFSILELHMWFQDLLEQYHKWARLEFEWKKIRQDSLRQMTFPFPYREGQKDLAKYVYQTIYHKKKLFLQAPTGVGKTISTVFPALKAMAEGKGDKLFYLTAKTITRTVATDTFDLLRESGLSIKTVVITAKEKCCPLEEMECNPDACPYANGHYDRINDAMYDLLTNDTNYSRDTILEYAKKHQVCPFEMCLDMTLFSDAIVCDYNYLFDPHVYLKRFFAESTAGDYLFLIDEAHNLLERGREMYSATVRKEDFLALKNVLKEYPFKYEKQIIKGLDKCNKELLALKREHEGLGVVTQGKIAPLILGCSRLYASMDKFLQEKDDSPVKQEVLEFYFVIRHFLDIHDRLDDNYVVYCQFALEQYFECKLFCVNPSLNLRECMQKGRSTILFSATFLPIQFYKKLLGGEEYDYEVYAKSTFEDKKRLLLIANDVTSKYTRRTQDEFYQIATYIHNITKERRGNYMLFFPSYSFMRQIYETYEREYEWQQDNGPISCMIQSEHMTEEEREEFLDSFKEEQEHTLLAFCVLGGIFSEGIDLKADRLIGAIIVGTGLPLVCNEREIMKDYFDSCNENGFDFAYRYPGMNKVLQAGGRVIRTQDDIGVIALLDERFLTNSYKKLFPREWESAICIERSEVAEIVEGFWMESSVI